VLNWLELDNRGHRLIVTDDCAINTPAVAAAYAVKRYAKQAADEISFEVTTINLINITKSFFPRKFTPRRARSKVFSSVVPHFSPYD